MMCLTHSQMKYASAFKYPNRSSVFTRPSQMSSQKDWDLKDSLRQNSSRERKRREVNVKYSNRELSPLQRSEYDNSKFVQSSVIKPLKKLISS